jgi:probable rRNA maturation factor
MNIEVTGSSPRLTRQEVITFARKVLLAAGGVGTGAPARPAAGEGARRHTEIGEISIAFVNDRAMRALNRKFRGKNKTTDVLTFPGDNACEIVISLDRAKRQAAEERHSLATELRYLLLHGILHGLGYDHATDSGEMDALELAVREKVGLM